MRIILFFFIVLVSCNSEDDGFVFEPSIEENFYFPPINSNTWETASLSALGWNESEAQNLLSFLENSNTQSFIMLHNGRIIIEAYFNGANSETNNPWFSAGKTLTATMVGIAEQESFLSLNDASNQYLGLGWTEATSTQESAITVKNHITMTTGLDFNVDFMCTDPACLQYLDAPNSFWYYHNAPYTLTQSIVSGAIGSDFNDYFNVKLRDPIGMQGSWVPFGFNKFYFSNARSMARFGLLNLNKGVWETTEILNEDFFNAMTTTSQNLNPAYGYLWWLNGKSSYILPSSENLVNGTLIPNAPNDLIAALGANDQKLYVVPSKKLVIVRMGNSGNQGQLGPSGYDNTLWEKINAVIN